ncbi:hypothetical protein CHU98_g696 [Xylaria longipes]|nr:hypothetical protein CHU98_g696 [Xylaria longipes]
MTIIVSERRRTGNALCSGREKQVKLPRRACSDGEGRAKEVVEAGLGRRCLNADADTDMKLDRESMGKAAQMPGANAKCQMPRRLTRPSSRNRAEETEYDGGPDLQRDGHYAKTRSPIQRR